MTLSNKYFTVPEIKLDAALRQQIQDRLDAFPRTQTKGANLTHAAVVLAIISADDQQSASFVLTRRPQHLHRHSGQYALPGGRIEAGETVEQAALRELHEEIGIQLPVSSVLGWMDDYPTRSGFLITPIVVWGGHVEHLQPDPNEVACAYRVPLKDLHSPAMPILEPSPNPRTQVLSVPLASIDQRIFAPTAAFVYQFREIALFGRDTRVAHFDQPKFAWS